MATIADNLQVIADSTKSIKQSIIAKGGDIKGDITTWADAINNIQGDGGKPQRVMYIRRNGTGSIDTGVLAENPNLKIVIRYAMRTFPSGYWPLINGYVNDSSNATRILFKGKNTIYASLCSIASKSLVINTTRYTNVIYTDILESPSSTNFQMTSNGLVSSLTRTSGPQITKNIVLFREASDNVDIELYHLEIYDNGALIRNFIPYINNGEYGLYDTVFKKFYGSTTGKFEGEIVNLE